MQSRPWWHVCQCKHAGVADVDTGCKLSLCECIGGHTDLVPVVWAKYPPLRWLVPPRRPSGRRGHSHLMLIRACNGSAVGWRHHEHHHCSCPRRPTFRLHHSESVSGQDQSTLKLCEAQESLWIVAKTVLRGGSAVRACGQFSEFCTTALM